MSCPDVRLEEYLDGELQGAPREAVEAHLASCEACRGELAELRRLEEVLRAVPAGAAPDAERFVARVRARSGRPRWAWLAAAAAVLVTAGLTVVLVARPGTPDVREVLARYAASPSPEAEAAIRAAGPRGLAVLEAALESPDPRVQFASASLLFKMADDATRERLVARFQGPVDVRAELEKYAKAPSAEAELRIRSAGPVGLAVLERALEDGDARVRFAAASLLFRYADGPTRDWALARFQQRKESNGAWTLLDPGAEDTDVEIVPAALSALQSGGGDRWAIGVLRKLNRLDRAAQRKIVDSVVTLLKHPDPRVQRSALEVVKELDMDFPLSALVDLIDSPELGEESLKVLRKAVGKDCGADKESWKKAIAMKEKGL
jgi:HEAT repeat protein